MFAVLCLAASMGLPWQGQEPPQAIPVETTARARGIPTEGIDNAVVADRTAYLLQDLNIAFKGKALELQWRSDGRRLLIVAEAADSGMPFRAGSELLVWDRSANKTTSLWKPRAAGTFIGDPHWLGTTSKFVVQTYANGEKGSVMVGDADTGSLREVYKSSQDGLMIVGSPSAPLLLLAEMDAGPSKGVALSILDTSLSPKKWITLPPTTGTPEWTPDGKTLLVTSYAPSELKPGQIQRGTYRLDFPGGALARIGDIDYEPPNSVPLTILDALTNVVSSGDRSERAITPSQDGSTSPGRLASSAWSLHGLVLAPSDVRQQKGNLALVASDGQEAVLAPDLSAVAFASNGMILVRTILKMDAAKFKTEHDAAEQALAMSNAKQAALALVMFSEDWDDSFPDQNGWSDKVMPYVKNEKILGGFNYTFGGGMIGKDKLATTQIGFTQGPGGRAVAYGDGHVVWVPDL